MMESKQEDVTEKNTSAISFRLSRINTLTSSDASLNGINLVGAVNSTMVRKTKGKTSSEIRIILRRNNILKIIVNAVNIRMAFMSALLLRG
jgi:pyocin large subunit-like protein